MHSNSSYAAPVYYKSVASVRGRWLVVHQLLAVQVISVPGHLVAGFTLNWTRRSDELVKRLVDLASPKGAIAGYCTRL